MLTRLRDRLRHLTPPGGQAYELFDCSVLIAAVVLVGYVIEPASQAQAKGLAVLGQSASLRLWGGIVGAAGLIGIVCSYRPGWLSAGYGIVVAACVLWSLAFLAGMVFFDGTVKALPSALVYAWVARRLITVGTCSR